MYIYSTLLAAAVHCSIESAPLAGHQTTVHSSMLQPLVSNCCEQVLALYSTAYMGCLHLNVCVFESEMCALKSWTWPPEFGIPVSPSSIYWMTWLAFACGFAALKVSSAHISSHGWCTCQPNDCGSSTLVGRKHYQQQQQQLYACSDAQHKGLLLCHL